MNPNHSQFTRKAAVTLLAVSALMAVGCGKAVDNVREDIDRTVEQLAITDTWKSPCNNASLDWLGVASQVESFEFGTSLRKVTTIFQEDACTVPAIEVYEQGKYKVGSKTPAEAYLLDMTFNEVSVKPVNDQGRDLLNSVNACGINDWRTGESRTVTQATSDNPVIDRCWTKTPRQVFDLANVTSDVLYFGRIESGLDKTSSENRPSRIDEAAPYTRQ